MRRVEADREEAVGAAAAPSRELAQRGVGDGAVGVPLAARAGVDARRAVLAALDGDEPRVVGRPAPAARPRAAGVRGVVVVDLADRRDVVAVRVEVRGQRRAAQNAGWSPSKAHTRVASGRRPESRLARLGLHAATCANARSNASAPADAANASRPGVSDARPVAVRAADEVRAQVVRDDQHDGPARARRPAVEQRRPPTRADHGRAAGRRRRAALGPAYPGASAPAPAPAPAEQARPGAAARIARGGLASASALATTTRRTRRAARPMFSSCSSRGAGRVRLASLQHVGLAQAPCPLAGSSVACGT